MSIRNSMEICYVSQRGKSEIIFVVKSEKNNSIH